MTKYKYKARDQDGNLVDGVHAANSTKEVAESLTDKNLIPVHIEKVKKKKGKKKKGKKKKGKKKAIFSLSERVKSKDIAIFCRQFSTMIAAGVSVAESLDDLSNTAENDRLRKIIGKILEDVRAGSSLSEAFSRYPSVFGNIFISMIKAGEESGSLSVVLKDLSLYLERKVKLRSQLRSASMYPMFIAGFFIVILLGLVLFLIPRFQELFESLGAELPVPTQIVMSISEFMVRNIPVLFFLVMVLVVAGVLVYRTKPGRYIIDSFIIKLPIFGDVIFMILLARFFQTLATLLKSGVDIVSSLSIAGKVSGNAKVERKVKKMQTGIIEGSSLSAELKKGRLFPRMAVSMTAVGEKSGAIDEMLVKVSDFYMDEVEAQVEGFSTLIEPILIISLGIIVGIFIITMYLPIFRMAAAIMAGA